MTYPATTVITGIRFKKAAEIVAPAGAREMSEMTRAALANDWEKARELQKKFLPLMQANFLESNPGPVKAVLAMMGRIEENYRLPMVPVKKETKAKLEKIASEAGILKAIAV